MSTELPEFEQCTQQDLPGSIDVDGNRLQLFVESAPYIEALVSDIRLARRRVWIESYTIADDRAGQAVAAALMDRAAAGVSCRLSYDAVGSFSTPARFFDNLRRAGVHVRAYRPLRPWLRHWRWLQRFHRRNHRKLAVIDDEISYFGGMNLVDQGGSGTPPQFDSRHPPLETAWRDVHVRMAGPATEQIATAFQAIWPGTARRAARRRRNPSVKRMLSADSDALFFIDARPRVPRRRPGPVFKGIIHQARKRITLAMAYFLPFGGVLRALLRARRQGVAIDVILPYHSDVPVVQWASRHMYEQLLRHGIHIYERRDRMLHSKAMVIDDQWSVVGSCNFDPRSLLINLEFFAVVRSTPFAAALSEICAHERRNSDRIRLSAHRRRSWRERLLHRLAWTFRRWL